MTTAELALLGGIPVDAELVDPQSLLSSLESATAVREVGPASGTGWTGSAYTFAVTATLPGPVHVTVSTTGTVDVDQQGRVRQLDAVESITGPAPIGGTERKVTLTFGDFGLPVSVSAPPASEVYTFRPRDRTVGFGPGAIPRASPAADTTACRILRRSSRRR